MTEQNDLVVPEVWAAEILRQMAPPGRYAAFLAGFGIDRPPPPRLPWHRRIPFRIGNRVYHWRERLALKIAPWLEQDPWA